MVKEDARGDPALGLVDVGVLAEEEVDVDVVVEEDEAAVVEFKSVLLEEEEEAKELEANGIPRRRPTMLSICWR